MINIKKNLYLVNKTALYFDFIKIEIIIKNKKSMKYEPTFEMKIIFKFFNVILGGKLWIIKD